MKKIIAVGILMLSVSSFAQELETSNPSNVVNAETINVDGTLVEKRASDAELESIKAEIQKQKKEVVLNKAKAKGFQQLSKSVENLSTTTEEYLLEKRAARQQIADYNEKVRCMQDEYPGRECDKYLKK